MPRTFQDSLCHDRQRIHVHPLTDYRSPVHYHTSYGIVMKHHVLYRIAVKDRSARLRRLINQSGSGMYRIHDIRAVSTLLITYAQFLDNRHSLFLHHDIVEHHSAAPHTSTGSQLTIKQRHLLTGFRQEISGHDTGRSPSHDRYIHRQVALQLLEVRVNDST